MFHYKPFFLVGILALYAFGVFQAQKFFKSLEQDIRLNVYLSSESLWPQWQQKILSLSEVQRVELLAPEQLQQQLQQHGIEAIDKTLLPHMVEITPRTFSVSALHTLRQQVAAVLGDAEIYFDVQQIRTLEQWRFQLLTVAGTVGMVLLLSLGLWIRT